MRSSPQAALRSPLSNEKDDASNPSRFSVLRADERGQGLVEYALILLLVSLAIVLLLTALGTDIRGLFESVRDAFP